MPDSPPIMMYAALLTISGGILLVGAAIALARKRLRAAWWLLGATILNTILTVAVAAWHVLR